MRTIRLWLSYLLVPLLRLVICILLRLTGHSRLRIGTLTFWGERGFLTTCNTAVCRLRELDPDLHASLTQDHKLLFYHSPRHLEQVCPAGYFSIDDAYYSWQADGVIARLVYAARLVVCGLPRFVTKEEQPSARAAHAAACLATTAWLAERSFPELLVDFFKEQS
jgi:hypothetical protein